MRCAILGFTGGAAYLQTLGGLPGQGAMIFYAALAILLLLALRGPARAAAAGALLGFSWAALIATVALAPQLARDDEGRDVTLIGTIDSLPYRFEQGVRFNFAVEQVVGSTMVVPPRVSLAWYEGFRPGAQQEGAQPAAAVKQVGAVKEVGVVQPGERWQLTVRLQRPHGNANPFVRES